jgi:PAS domain S-box-containing protein
MTEQDGFRVLVEGLPEPVARLAPDLRIAYVNEALCARFAESREALIGRSILTLVPESDRESLAQHLASLDAEHPVGRFESSGAPSGEEPGGLRWIIRAVHDDEENLLEYQALMHDRGGAHNDTKPENADGPLARIEKSFRSVVHNSSEIVKIVDLDGTLRYASPAFGRVLGYNPELTIGTNVLEYVHPEDLPHVLEETKRASNGAGTAGSKAEYRFKHKGGSWRHMESVVTNLLDDPAIRGVVVNSRDITERKKYEDALRRSEGNLAEAQRMASLGNWEHDYSKDEIYWSDELYRVLGIVPGEVEPSWEAFLERVHPDDRDGVRQTFQEALRNERQDTTEYRVLRPDGGTRVMQSRREVVLGPDGRPIRVAGTVRDVTEQREADLALREAEERYRTLVERVPAITFVQTQEPEGRSFTTYVSPQVETIPGYPPDEWTGDPEFWRKVLHPDDRERFLAEDRRLGEAGESLNTDFRMFAKDGRRVVWLRQSSTLLRGGDGQCQVWHGVMLDITELKQVEEDLRGAEERFRSLVEQVPPIIYVQEPKPGEVATYRTTYISPRVRKVLGYPPSHFQEDTAFWESRIHPEDLERVVAENARTDETGEPFEMEYRMIHHDGRTVWVRDEAVLFPGEPHGPVYWQGVISDVTERKDLEEKLERRAFHDPLTNLPNRALFADRLGGALERTRRRGKKVAVLFMDLNGFKVVNDSLGHRAGDLLLVIVGERLRRSLRPEDALARGLAGTSSSCCSRTSKVPTTPQG